MSRLFGPDFITQKYLRQYPNSERARSWAGVMVHIQIENGVWRTGGSGYTWAGKPDAWVLPFEDAVKQIDHCGPEKMGRFLRATPSAPETKPIGFMDVDGLGTLVDEVRARPAAPPSPQDHVKEAGSLLLKEASLPTTSRLSQLEARTSWTASGEPSTTLARDDEGEER